MKRHPLPTALLLAALLLAACANRPAPATAPVNPPSAGGGSAEASATPLPSATPGPAVSVTPAVTASPTLPPSDTPLPPTDTPLPASATSLPPATDASTTTQPDSTVPPASLDTVEPPTTTPSPVPSITPAPPSNANAPDVSYVVYSEQALGEYVARIWVQADNPFPNLLSLGTIDRGAERLVQIDSVAGFEPLPAADLTGEGQFDVAFALRWGGSHCCNGTVLYNLGDTPQQVLWVGGEIGTGTFEDLDGDGDWEFITRDRVSGLPCTQPSPMAVLAYSPSMGYTPASPQYPAVFEPEIVDYTAQAELRLQENGVRTQCDIADLMLDYLYSGQAERGAAEFARLYPLPDAADYWAALLAAARGGQLYVEAAP